MVESILIHCDVKSLELVTAAYLSRDETLIGEIKAGTDIHEANRARFDLPERRIAKIFVFRLIYGGQAYSYAHDSDFNFISKDVKYWQEVIDAFYYKYKGIRKWHEELVQQVLKTGRLVMPTGRTFVWDRLDVAKRLWFHTPKILNYPVQGTGADLVAIARVTMHRRLAKAGIKVLFISTVHDSIDIDLNPCYNIYEACKIVEQSIKDVPINFERLFGIPFDLPLSCETSFGPTLKNTISYTGQTE